MVRTRSFRLMLPFLLVATSCGGAGTAVHADPEVTIACAVQEGDLDFHTLLTICHYTRERFAVLFARPSHPLSIIVHDTTAMTNDFQHGRVFFYQPSREAMGKARALFTPEQASQPHDPTLLLSHEIMHTLLYADTYDGVSRPDPHIYGTVLPDWFDEGVAIWAEPEELRSSRMQTAAALDDSALDLLSFARRDHPLAGGIDYQRAESVVRIFRCLQPPCPPSPVGRDTFRIISRIDRAGAVNVDTVFPEDPGFYWLNTDEFYAISSTILPFFYARGRSHLVNILLDRMMRGQTAPELFNHLPGLPPDPADVGRDWLRFVRSRADTARAP